jgi:hypothetical protein
MPTSHLHQLNDVVELIKLTDPRRLLDIGIGFGKYGFLSREYLELWDGRERYNDWQRTIDGIEAYGGYVTPLQRLVYSKIFIGNALEVLPSLAETYDLVLLIDVLEHFGYEDGVRLLGECRRVARNLLVSVPKVNDQQGSLFGNEYETHRFQWTKAHLHALLGGEVLFMRNRYSTICYVGANRYEVSSRLRTDGRVHFWTKQVKPKVVAALEYCHLKSIVKHMLGRFGTGVIHHRRNSKENDA